MQDSVALKINEVSAESRVGRTKVYEAIKRGELKAKKHGKSTIVLRVDMLDWLNALPEA